MGLLSSIGSALTSAAKAVYNSPVGTVLNFTTAATAHPIKAVQAVATGTVSSFEKQFYSQSLTKQITQIVSTTAAEAALVVGVGAAAKVPSAVNIVSKVSSVLPTVKSKVIAAVAVPVVASAVLSQPAASAKAVASIPSTLSNVGVNLGTLVTNPSIANAKTLISENPVAVTIGAAAGALAIGGLSAGTIASVANTMATNKSTAATKEATMKAFSETPTQAMLVSSTPTTDTVTIPAQNNNPIPQTAATQTVSAAKINAKRRRKAIVKPQNISQRVSVLVNANNIKATKNYINKEILVH